MASMVPLLVIAFVARKVPAPLTSPLRPMTTLPGVDKVPTCTRPWPASWRKALPLAGPASLPSVSCEPICQLPPSTSTAPRPSAPPTSAVVLVRRPAPSRISMRPALWKAVPTVTRSDTARGSDWRVGFLSTRSPSPGNPTDVPTTS